MTEGVSVNGKVSELSENLYLPEKHNAEGIKSIFMQLNQIEKTSWLSINIKVSL